MSKVWNVNPRVAPQPIGTPVKAAAPQRTPSADATVCLVCAVIAGMCITASAAIVIAVCLL
jgi:hypothetical protein